LGEQNTFLKGFFVRFSTIIAVSLGAISVMDPASKSTGVLPGTILEIDAAPDAFISLILAVFICLLYDLVKPPREE
jgi:hypothetical protein